MGHKRHSKTLALTKKENWNIARRFLISTYRLAAFAITHGIAHPFLLASASTLKLSSSHLSHGSLSKHTVFCEREDFRKPCASTGAPALLSPR